MKSIYTKQYQEILSQLPDVNKWAEKVIDGDLPKRRIKLSIENKMLVGDAFEKDNEIPLSAILEFEFVIGRKGNEFFWNSTEPILVIPENPS